MFLIGEEKTVARPFDSTAQWLKSDSCRLGVELEMLHCSSLMTRRIVFLAIIVISDCAGTRSAREGGFGQAVLWLMFGSWRNQPITASSGCAVVINTVWRLFGVWESRFKVHTAELKGVLKQTKPENSAGHCLERNKALPWALAQTPTWRWTCLDGQGRGRERGSIKHIGSRCRGCFCLTDNPWKGFSL